MSNSRSAGRALALSHTKSRRGCTTCKARKVKCDESRPSCTACARHKVLCEYVTPSKSTRRARAPTQPSSTSTPSITSDQSVTLDPAGSPATEVGTSQTSDAPNRRLLELRLLHHFVTSTIYEDFPSGHDPNVREMWRVYAPKLAFEHPFFLNAILSVALLHLTKLEPRNEEWADQHRRYFDAAVSEFRKETDHICPQNAEAVCLAASVISLTSASLIHKDTTAAKYSPPLQYLSLLSGTRPLYAEALPMVPETSMVMSLVTAAPNMADFEVKVAASREKYLALFPHLTNWTAPNETIDPESQRTYDVILSYIGSIVESIENEDPISETRRIVQSFTAFMPPTYPMLLQRHNPRALVILAHFFCLYKAVDNVWWMRGIAEREVFGIQSILPEQWQWAMAWPLQKLAFFAASAATSATPPLPV